MNSFISTSSVCSILGISLSSFYRYCKAGLSKPAFVTPSGHRRFSLNSIEKLNNSHNNEPDSSQNLVFCYSRVSSSDQKSDLVTQQNKLLNYAKSLHLSSDLEIFPISDLGSGLNYKKKGLNLLISLILNSKVHTLIINHKDRLLRFGSEIIFKLCLHFNVNVIIMEKSSNLSFEQQLSSDVIELMTVFCAKLYGKRSHSNKSLLC